MIENTQGIDEIVMRPRACCKCVIGNDWYINAFEITFIPSKVYPDYMQVNEWIMGHIDGQALNIEDAVERVYNYLMETYSPRSLYVVDEVKGAKTHFDVIVTKRGRGDI